MLYHQPELNHLAGHTGHTGHTMLKKYIASLLLLLGAALACAQPYGHYDATQIVLTSQTPAGKTYSLDMPYLDRMLNDLARHALGYPTRFDTPEDQQRATRDAQALGSMLDILLQTPQADAALLLRAGIVHSIGHNLDIAGAAPKADATFQRLLAAQPDDAQGNYMYGNFLAGSGQSQKAVTFLEKALALGVTDANYSLGLNYLTLGDTQKALAYFEAHLQQNPDNQHIKDLVEAIQEGRFEIKTEPGTPR